MPRRRAGVRESDGEGQSEAARKSALVLIHGGEEGHSQAAAAHAT